MSLTDSPEARRKLIIAVVVLLVAGGVLAWGLSTYLSEGPTSTVDPAIEARERQMQEELERSLPKGQPPAPATKGPDSPFLSPSR